MKAYYLPMGTLHRQHVPQARYELLTGVYPWRNKDAKILPGTAPLIIDTTQVTIPKMLKKQGYKSWKNWI